MTRVLDYNATVTRRIEVASGLDIFQIAPDEPIPPFEAGQYLTLGLNRSREDPDDPRPLSVLRPMTITSGGQQTDQLEFLVQHVDKPESRLPLTHLMWDLKKESRIYLRTAVTGRFTESSTYNNLNGRRLVMVAGGTGVAPFLSMIRTKIAQQSDVSLMDHILLLGAYNPNYLSHLDEIHQWVENHGLIFVPTMSRPHESLEWSGLKGRVDQCFAKERIHETEQLMRCALHPREAVVMVCGLGDVVSGTIQNLLSRGFVPENRRMRKLLEVSPEHQSSLFYEQYDAEPILDFRNEHLLNSLREKWSQCKAA
ncbi:MAG: hypothetical protein KTR25_10070 [Myxococcales bacterium]|nr:hypothetical protein [Myxococcales bacterium]